MADEQNTDQMDPGTAASGPDKPAAAFLPLTVAYQYIKDLSIESPNAPASIANFGQSQPEIKLNVDVRVNPTQERTFEVVLALGLEAKHGEQTDFLVELQYGGLCALGEIAEELVRPVLFVEVPRLLFPFARQIITNAMREAGFPPIVMNPIDFGALYKQRVDQLAAQQAAGDAATPGSASSPNGGNGA